MHEFKALMNKKIRFFRIFLEFLIIGIVFISGCVQEKIPTPVQDQSPTVSPTIQPSATPLEDATHASGATLTVAKSGGVNYTKIQDAINNSNDGDTILVYSGTYYESVDVNKQLILRGVDTGGGKPVVDANRSGSVAIALSAGNSVVEGFTATGSAYYPYGYSAGILVNSNNNLLRNNTASDNYYGITLYHYSKNNTLIDNNALNNNHWGIGLYYSHYNRLTGNNASKNKGGGIYLYYSSNNALIGNNVSNNQKGIHLQSSWLYPNDNNTIIGNTASYNDVGINLDSSSNNTLTGNKANSNNNKGIVLEYGSNNNILSSNYVLKNNYGIDMPDSSNNTIYNNLFNNRENIDRLGTLLHNTWNTTKQPGINIIGEPYLGGNYWANPGRIDFSVICSDSDHDGICDSPYTLDDNNSDYLSLAYKPGIANTILVEDTDFKFSNKCEIQKIPRATNGSLLACLKAGGEKINVTFTGTAASIIFVGSPSGGIVKVQIDGKEYPEINTGITEETVPWTLESGLRIIQRIASNLQNTGHILTFEIANRSTTPSKKQNEAGDIYIDTIEIKTE